ncbi:hypothetical protein [Bradyrhizobium diazoefficiens]
MMIRDMSERAIKSSKKVPLEVMLKNMNRFDKEADSLSAELQRLRQVNVSKMTQKALIKHIERLKLVWSAFRECTLDAQKFAVDAAPFMHQRLAMLTVKPEDSSPINRIREETAMSDDELAAYYNDLRLRPATVEPMVVTLGMKMGIGSK